MENNSINKSSIAVSYTSAEQKDIAKNFSQQHQLPLIKYSENSSEYVFLLVFTEEHLELRQTQTKQKPLYIDFSQGNIYKRIQKNAGKELLKKALGLKPDYKPQIIDATAGFGQDAILLASFGCKVIMLERSPILHALLEDGLKRFYQTKTHDFDITLIASESLNYLEQLKELPDIIYLDPMYPHRNKSMLAKKEMQWIRQIVGEDSDSDLLLEIALRKASKRVIVKRPRLAKPLNDHEPDFSITGRSQRFDVYLIK